MTVIYNRTNHLGHVYKKNSHPLRDGHLEHYIP